MICTGGDNSCLENETLSGRPGRALARLLVVSSFFAMLAAPVSAGGGDDHRPNFVFVLAEAQGWSSLSSGMDDTVPASKSELNLTVNLDRLAARGMRFSQAYASSPRCTPSRATLMTGKSPAQLHMTFVNDGRARPGDAPETNRKLIEPRSLVDLSAGEVTFAELLRREGYATAHFGKWHLGRSGPAAHGFEESDGATANEGLTNNPGETERMTDRAIDFMSRQHKAGKPFYLQVSHYPARTSADVLATTVDAVKQRLGGKLNRGRGGPDRTAVDIAANQIMDESIGRLMRHLDELGLADHTYFIFSADHGSQGRQANVPLTNGKGTVWEGGIRVPLIIRGPGIAAGSYSHEIATGADLFPTVLELAQLKTELPKGIEGGTLVPVLTHAGSGIVRRARPELVFHFPHYDMDEWGPASAIISGNYKLIRFYAWDAPVLYDLQTDIAERQDLSKQLPAKTHELDMALRSYLKEVGADLPTANPKFDPNAGGQLLKPNRGK